MSFLSYAGKPELILRYSDADSWKIPNGYYCFNTNPITYKDAIYLRCSDGDYEHLFKITNTQTTSIYKSGDGHKLTDPSLTVDGLLWSEFSEGGTHTILDLKGEEIRKVSFKPQGMIDGMASTGEGEYVFRWLDFDGEQFVTKWKNTAEIWMDHPDRSFAFSPSSAPNQLAYKLRLNSLDDSSPDLLYWWADLGKSPLVLKDRDSDANSSWLSFRNSVILSGSSMLFVGRMMSGVDGIGLMDESGVVKTIAQVGSDKVKEIDYFSPSINKHQTVVFRGVDESGMKTIFMWKNDKISVLLRQDDVVHTDKGPARINYQDPSAVFMSAPFLSEDSLFIQTALVDFDDEKTLIGVGLLRLRIE